jgi:hypothetical protein
MDETLRRAVLAAATTDKAAELLVADGCPADRAQLIAAMERGESDAYDLQGPDGPELPEEDL